MSVFCLEFKGISFTWFLPRLLNMWNMWIVDANRHSGDLFSTWRSQVASGLSGMCWPHIWIQFHLTRRGCSKDSSDVTLVKLPHVTQWRFDEFRRIFVHHFLGEVIETSWITSRWTVTDSHSEEKTHHCQIENSNQRDLWMLKTPHDSVVSSNGTVWNRPIAVAHLFCLKAFHKNNEKKQHAIQCFMKALIKIVI